MHPCCLDFLPHAVLLDLAMPKQDGFEIAQKLLNSDLPKFELIALSGYCDPEMRERCARAGFSRFLAKPVSLEELQMLLSESSRPPSGLPLLRTWQDCRSNFCRGPDSNFFRFFAAFFFAIDGSL
jgi:CheY-like chemotaxis protein